MSRRSDRAFARWNPHLSPKTKRVVLVTFEDGSSVAVEDPEAELRAYAECLSDDREEAKARTAGYPSAAFLRALRRAEASVEASQRASKPRKAVTKQELLKVRREFEQDHGKQQGWKKVACAKFGIDPKTLNERIKE